MKGCSAHWMSNLIQLSAAANDCLNRHVDEALEPHKHGGISRDGTYAWLYHSSYLEVISTQTGERMAAWCFGVPLKDPTTTICCCEEIVYNGSSKLIVSTDSVMGDMLLVFDICTSKVSKAIQMPYKVTSTEVISSIGTARAPDHVLSEHLKEFCGILAVGTHCGHLYLIDLNLDEDTTSDEVDPAVLSYIDPHSCNISSQRCRALEKGNHLCLQLAEDVNKRGSFFYKKPDEEVVKSFPADEVFISCLHWIQQTGQLAVGFNFGSFQLWRLSVPVLEYTGRYEDDNGPVSHFAYTEPENDPRNFCYLWVSRGPLPSEHQVDYNSYIVLHQLGFNKRSKHAGYGHYFEDLTSVGSRFEHELGVDPCNRKESSECGSRLVSCFTLHDANYRVPQRTTAEDSFEEGCCGPDLSLTAFIWEAGYADPKPSSYLSLFDMNRWYHAQMPYTIRPSSSGRDVCPYFVFHSLDEVMNICNPAGLMGVHIPYSSLNKFHSPQIPAPEQHFFPSALAFDSCFLAENGLVHCKYLGLQRQLLSDLQKRGPSVIIDPTEIYVRATLSGLLPRIVDVNVTLSQLYKREAMLSLVLDYGLIFFLNSCVSQFGSGDFVLRGCTLRFLLEWAWKKVTAIKEDIDQLTVQLYDWSGMVLDCQTLKILHQHHSSLNHLVHLLQKLTNQPATQIGLQDLETKHSIAVLIKQYLHMVLWFYSAGLLPENSDDEVVPPGQYAYPAKVMKETFRKRRNGVQRLHSEIQSSDVLHIDCLVERQGALLRQLLEKNGETAHYPFPNFHSLLNMYLVDGIPYTTKLTLTFYVLCDLFSVLPEEEQQQFNDKLQHFAQAFSLAVSIQKYVQGIWLLDHKDYKDALVYLLDPCLSHELESWQHRVTIKAFLYQGQHQLALRYIRVKKPPLSTPEDVKLRLTTLLANGLMSEAFEYQRLCRDHFNADDLLSHLFIGSIQTKTVDQLLQLPFTEDEEHHLVNYLKSNKDINSQELLLMYYLQRSRYIEAIRLNQKMVQTPMNELGSSVCERAGTRKSIVDGYYMVLPHVQRKLAFSPDQPLEKRPRSRRTFTRPKPLSTTVNRSDRSQTVTRATLLKAVLEKTKEITEEAEIVQDDSMSSHQEHFQCESEEPGPFICTPVTERLRKRVSEAGEVVFASTSKTKLVGGALFLDSPAPAIPGHSPLKRPCTSSTMISPKQTQLSVLSGVKTNTRRLTSAADLTLLQTPPVKRRTPPSKRPLLKVETPKTPQSILKVRQHPVRRSPSPQVFAQRTKSEIVMPTPPVPRTRLARLAASQPPASPKVSLPSSNPGTPKQIRFSMPNTSRGETPTPEKEPHETTPSSSSSEDEVEVSDVGLVAESKDVSPTPRRSIHIEEEEMEEEEKSTSLRSVRDRSPTPERQSPKLASKTDYSPSTVRTQDIIEIDSEVTFNFTENISRIADTNESRNTEPLTPVGQLYEGSVLATENAQSQISTNQTDNYQKSIKHVICLNEDSSENNYDEYKKSRVGLLIEEDQNMDTESSEEEHQEIVIKKTSVAIEVEESDLSSQEEHKEVLFEDYQEEKDVNTEEEHIDVTSSEEEQHKETVSSEEEHRDHEEEYTEKEHHAKSSEQEKESSNSFSQKDDKITFVSEEHKNTEVNIVQKSVSEKNLIVHEKIKETTESYKKVVTPEYKGSSVPQPNVETASGDDVESENVVFSFSKPLDISFDADKIDEMEAEMGNDELDHLHLELEEEENQGANDGIKQKPVTVTQSETSFTKPNKDVSTVHTTRELESIETMIKMKPLVTAECTKEQADSSDDQAPKQNVVVVVEDMDSVASVSGNTLVEKEVQRTPKRSPGRPARRTPTRKTPTRGDNEEVTESPSRRRSMRLAAKDIQESLQQVDKTPVKAVGRHGTHRESSSSPSPSRFSPRLTRRHKLHKDSCAVCSGNVQEKFRTPPRPTRLAMPPTPPESSSPASTSSVDTQDQPASLQVGTSSTTNKKQPTTPTRRVKASARTPPRAPGIGAKSKARSRSSSPPVVTSTTDDLPIESESSATYLESDTMQTQPVNEGPLSNDSFMMTMRSGRRISREPSPQGSEVSGNEDVEFTFSKPQEIQTTEEEFESQPAASFVFSPPLTRGRSRRMSLTSAATPNTSSIDLIPALPEHEILKAAANKLSHSPAKRPRKTSTRTIPVCAPTDSPINFLPENDTSITTQSRQLRNKVKKDEGPTMTLRTRGQLAKVTKKRRKPIAW